jgi:type VII secretion integral membrane protein EccD
VSASTASELCRIVVVAPRRTAELAVPAHVPLVDLMPHLVSQIDEELAEEWVGRGVHVQRLGEEPLDEEQTPAGLGLRDGDTLYLRPRDTAMPALVYDDLIDSVASRLRDRAGRWSATATRRLFLGVALGLLGLGQAMLLADGPKAIRALIAGATGAVLLVAAATAARAFADRGSGVVLGFGAVCYAAVCGLLVPGAVAAGPVPGAANLLGSAAVATAAALLAGLATGEARPLLLGLGATGAQATLGGVLVAFGLTTPAQAAAVIAALALLLSAVIPSLAFWLAGLRLPDLPTTAEEIGKQEPLVPEEILGPRTALAEDYVTALYAALGVACAGALTWLIQGDGWPSRTLAGVVCALLALRFRMLTHVWQRLAVLAPACYGAGLLVLGLAAGLHGETRLIGVVTGLLAIACGSLVAARILPRRRVRPYWGRAAEVLESVLGAALVPLVLAVLGIFELVRGLGG